MHKHVNMFLCRHLGIPNEQKESVQDLLIKHTLNTNSNIRLAAVRALGELEVNREEGWLSIIRRLIDESCDVREEAKNTLRRLKGRSR